MATYYRWRKSTIVSETASSASGMLRYPWTGFYQASQKATPNSGQYTMSGGGFVNLNIGERWTVGQGTYVAGSQTTNMMVLIRTTLSIYRASDGQVTIPAGEKTIYTATESAGTFQGYVYSTSSGAYPNGGVSGSYYYDQRTTVTSPTAPTGLTYPATITTPSVSVSWTAATSATDYPVSLYEVSYSTNSGSSWTVAGTTAEVSYTFSITPGTTSIMFRVRAQDSNGQWGGYVTGTASQVLLAPTLTVPQMVMQGQQATISWSAIEGADSYTLQRKSSADADWTQVYSGANLSYTETVGTWTSLQYRVQAVFDETPGGWATSDPIQIVSASALVISGQDGDLGTLVNDVPYSISSDQTSPTIDVTVEVNGGEYAAFQATSGQTYKVGVLDLPTGTGSIVITATTTVSESPVTVTRTWTYSKTAQTFPNSGSVATLTKEGNVVYPETLIEAVRASMPPWGGNLSTALELLKRAALFNRTKQPKYSEVTVSMANVTEGQIIRIPRGGVMVPHYVGKLEYESGLNGAGRRLMVPVSLYSEKVWDAENINAYSGSDIDNFLNSEYKELFPEDIQMAMGTTEFYYTPGNGNNTVSTLSRAIFLLSVTEFNAPKSDTATYNTEGSPLSNHISNLLRNALYNGERRSQWTRSPYIAVNTNAIWINQYGQSQGGGAGVLLDEHILPVFTLPSTFTGTYYVDAAGTIHDQQEYTEAGDWLDVWGDAIPTVKIETGSYVGTGTYGQSNPNTLTFPFEPKAIILGNPLNPGASDGWGIGFIWIIGNQNFVRGGATVYVQTSGTSVSWYSLSSPGPQCNVNGSTYYYFAIG